MPLTIDPIAYKRESLHSWINRSNPAEIDRIMKVQRNLDSNIRKPVMPTGWRPLAAVASEKNICPGHLARQCREIYAAQELARICTHKGRHTWCLSPECITQLRATVAPSGKAVAPRKSQIENPAEVSK